MADDGAEAEVEEEQSVPLSQDDVNAGLSELASSVDGTSVVRPPPPLLPFWRIHGSGQRCPLAVRNPATPCPLALPGGCL